MLILLCAVFCELFFSVLHISCCVFPVDNIGKFVGGNDRILSEIVQCSFLGLLSHIKIVFTYICLSWSTLASFVLYIMKQVITLPRKNKGRGGQDFHIVYFFIMHAVLGWTLIYWTELLWEDAQWWYQGINALFFFLVEYIAATQWISFLSRESLYYRTMPAVLNALISFCWWNTSFYTKQLYSYTSLQA